MAALVTVGPESITIDLSGLNSVSTRRRHVRIPLEAITAIRESGERATEGVRTVSAPLTGVRSAVFERDGKTVLVISRPGRPTITLDLDRTAFPDLAYDTVVLSLDRSEVVV